MARPQADMGTATAGSITNPQPHSPPPPIRKSQCDVTLSLTSLHLTKYQRFSYLTETEGHYMRLVLTGLHPTQYQWLGYMT
jgi:hypothetical protein